tara:strand:- start:794 stop:1033 length:240 start_codon:yes stop_codon:yes gene_type:complete
MSYIIFRDRLEIALNGLGFPLHHEERIKAFSQLFKLSKHTAASIISGTIIPNNDILSTISDELEVSSDWLLGNSESKKL